MIRALLLSLSVVWFAHSTLFASSNSIEGRNTGGFVTGTKILSGNEFEFYDVDQTCVGSELTSLNEDTFETTPQKLVDKFYHTAETVVEIGFDETSEINTLAYDQVVFTKLSDVGTYKWKKAEDLKAGDKVVRNGGDLLTVSSLRHITDEINPFEVWNLELAENHTFFVGEENQILVHNAVFLIPIATVVIGEGVVWAGASALAAATAAYLIDDALEKNRKANKAPTDSGPTMSDSPNSGQANKVYEPGTKISFDRFSERVKRRGQNAILKDPKTGEYLERDVAGGRGHGGSRWKLKDKKGNRKATVGDDGKILRK